MVDHRQSILLSSSATTTCPHAKKKSFHISDLCYEYINVIGRICGFRRTQLTRTSSRSSSPTKLSDLLNDNKPAINEVHSFRLNQESMKGNRGGSYRHKNTDYFVHTHSTKLPGPSPSPRSSFVPSAKIDGFPQSFSRNLSRGSAPIMFSSSLKAMKPPTMQINLDCTLEELCYGCTKQIRVSRDVCTNTRMTKQVEEMLTINIKPGWKTGTKITFEGIGNEKEGYFAADITFAIQEIRHSLFRREGNDLQLGVEIPLIKALIRCQVSVPLLGGDNKSLDIDDIIYPGYEVVISGQGMPISKENGKRGNLKVVFLVKFPIHLTTEKRLEISSILDECN